MSQARCLTFDAGPRPHVASVGLAPPLEALKKISMSKSTFTKSFQTNFNLGPGGRYSGHEILTSVFINLVLANLKYTKLW